MAQRSFFSQAEFAEVMRDAQRDYDNMSPMEQNAWDMLIQNIKYKLVAVGASNIQQKGSQ